MMRGHPQFIENFVDGMFGDDIEEVIPIDEVTQRFSNDLEVGLSAFIGSVL